MWLSVICKLCKEIAAEMILSAYQELDMERKPHHLVTFSVSRGLSRLGKETDFPFGGHVLLGPHRG